MKNTETNSLSPVDYALSLGTAYSREEMEFMWSVVSKVPTHTTIVEFGVEYGATVVHVGCNDGYEIEWYLKLGMTVWGFEPLKPALPHGESLWS